MSLESRPLFKLYMVVVTLSKHIRSGCHLGRQSTRGNVSINSGEEFLLVNTDRHQYDYDNIITVKPAEEFLQVDHDQSTMAPIEESLSADGRPHTSEICKGISKISELTLDQFQNNYKLFAKKLDGIETGLVIRAILFKNSEVIFNYSFKIIGTDNILNATIAAANMVCNLFLVHALKGDTFTLLHWGRPQLCTCLYNKECACC